MNIHDLEILLAVSKEKSLRSAAESLNLTQSAISKKIKSIEKDLEVTLYNRNNRGITLTDEGREFLQYANRALDILKEGIHTVKLKHGHNKIIKVGVAPPLISMVEKFCHFFLSKQNTVEIVTSNSPNIIKKLHEGAFDYGLFGSHLTPGKLNAVRVHQQYFYLVGKRIFLKDFEKFNDLTLTFIRADFIKALSTLPMVLPQRGINVREIIDDMYDHELIQNPYVVAEADTLDLIEYFVKHQYGCAFVPQTKFNPLNDCLPTDDASTRLRIQSNSKNDLYRVPVDFLFPTRYVYFAQAPHIKEDIVTKVRLTYKHSYIKDNRLWKDLQNENIP
ncbi:LysR family transcriptional regulator [Bacillus piscicola]|uniref:LysR family transcriptional regulator n=1 Tax=Bacillus piscicola TaxID=1632684 RepID=UPI001F088893|nr:LysR family transcriptional regulator [Bacillus piscicola]